MTPDCLSYFPNHKREAHKGGSNEPQPEICKELSPAITDDRHQNNAEDSQSDQRRKKRSRQPSTASRVSRATSRSKARLLLHQWEL